jgi:N-acetylmuramoyl-L-alanine amidase
MKIKLFLFILALFLTEFVNAASVQLKKIQLISLDTAQEIQFDFSGKPETTFVNLKNPDRVVMDFDNAVLKNSLPAVPASNLYLKKISKVKQKAGKTRLVLDLKQEGQYKTNLKKIDSQTYRYSFVMSFKNSASLPVSQATKQPVLDAVPLPASKAIKQPVLDAVPLPASKAIKQPVLDAAPLLTPIASVDSNKILPVSTDSEDNKKDSQPVLEPATDFKAVEELPAPVFTPPSKFKKVPGTNKNEKLQDLVIVLDPGHGGKDSGALGRRGTQEKNVVLAISRYLQQELQVIQGIKVFMTRSSDVFIPLRERLNIARQHKADLFIALHADSFKDSAAHGASVFALSERGATSEGARWLAEKENESEMLGGADLSDKDQLLKSVLLDMSQTATINSSLFLGDQILGRFRNFSSLHSNKVEQAAFVVLKSPDTPSILIENGFISNLKEEKNLSSADYQQKLAKEIRVGVVAYFMERAPNNTVFYQTYIGKS